MWSFVLKNTPSKVIIGRGFVPWANNSNSINHRLEKWIVPGNVERNITPKKTSAQQLVSLFLLPFLRVDIINVCAPGVVQGTKNDEATVGLTTDTDVEEEPVPLSWSPPNPTTPPPTI